LSSPNVLLLKAQKKIDNVVCGTLWLSTKHEQLYDCYSRTRHAIESKGVMILPLILTWLILKLNWTDSYWPRCRHGSWKRTDGNLVSASESSDGRW
jgi:hypothetical protein